MQPIRRELDEQRLLARLGLTVAGSVELHQTIDEVCHLLANGNLAELCCIDVAGEEGEPHVVRVVHSDPAQGRLAQELENRTLRQRRACLGRLAFNGGPGVLLAEVSASDLRALAEDEDHLALLEQLGAGSMLIVPLRGSTERSLLPRGDVSGALGLVRGGQRPYDAADLRFAAEIAARVAVGVHQARLFQSLERAVRMRDEVLGVVAHDLRNPINVIRMAAGSLSQRLCDAPAHKALARIVRGTQRANRLIQDLLDIGAIEAGRFSVEKRTVEIADVVLAAIESQQSLASSASIILASDVSPELPRIEADEERLLEVLENLVGNAIKFTPAGGTVSIGACTREDEVVISVKDTGAGIPADQLPHLFDRFWQAQKKDRRGVGLGLTICKAIVLAHAGDIRVESTVGAGTTVSFTIPSEGPRSRDSRPDMANILLVDDRPENILTLQAILERPDYRLVPALSGEEALRCALREQFSVALIDVAMPGMGGLEVATHLKALERSRDIPILFVTAFGDDPEEIHRAYAAGGADYLVKPLDAEIVRKKVAVFVGLSRRRDKDLRAQRTG